MSRVQSSRRRVDGVKVDAKIQHERSRGTRRKILISTQVSIITESPERLKKSESDIPMGRLARPEEIAGAVSYLLSPDASFTHGANIRVAGGRGPGTTLG